MNPSTSGQSNAAPVRPFVVVLSPQSLFPRLFAEVLFRSFSPLSDRHRVHGPGFSVEMWQADPSPPFPVGCLLSFRSGGERDKVTLHGRGVHGIFLEVLPPFFFPAASRTGASDMMALLSFPASCLPRLAKARLHSERRETDVRAAEGS